MPHCIAFLKIHPLCMQAHNAGLMSGDLLLDGMHLAEMGFEMGFDSGSFQCIWHIGGGEECNFILEHAKPVHSQM